MSGHVRAEPAGGERPHRAMNTRPRLPTGRRAEVKVFTDWLRDQVAAQANGGKRRR